MSKFSQLLETLSFLANTYGQTKSFVHNEEIYKAKLIEFQPFPEIGLHTPTEAIIFTEDDTVAVFFSENNGFTQIHANNRQFVSFLNPCLIKIRYQGKENERLSAQMHLFHNFLHTALIQNKISPFQYENSLKELEFLFSPENMKEYQKVLQWIHDEETQMKIAA